MKTRALYDLMVSFANDQSRYEVAAFFEADPGRRAWFERQAGTIAVIVVRIRAELAARDAPGARASGESERFDDYLERVLERYLDLDEAVEERALQAPATPSERACSRVRLQAPGGI